MGDSLARRGRGRWATYVALAVFHQAGGAHGSFDNGAGRGEEMLAESM